jgi:hypothetical protein
LYGYKYATTKSELRSVIKPHDYLTYDALDNTDDKLTSQEAIRESEKGNARRLLSQHLEPLVSKSSGIYFEDGLRPNGYSVARGVPVAIQCRWGLR